MKRRLSLAGPVRICTIRISAREGTPPRPAGLGVDRGKPRSEVGARYAVPSLEDQISVKYHIWYQPD